jgi:hypothetical protein
MDWRERAGESHICASKCAGDSPFGALDERFHETDPIGVVPILVIPGCARAGDSRSECRPGIHSAMDSPMRNCASGLAHAALRASHAPRNDDCCWSLPRIDMIRSSETLNQAARLLPRFASNEVRRRDRMRRAGFGQRAIEGLRQRPRRLRPVVTRAAAPVRARRPIADL